MRQNVPSCASPRAFEAVRKEARRLAAQGVPVEPEPLRKLDHRGRIVLGLFAATDRIAAKDVAHALGLSDRMARVLLGKWVDDGWIAAADPSRRARAYELTAIYRPMALTRSCPALLRKSDPPALGLSSFK